MKMMKKIFIYILPILAFCLVITTSCTEETLKTFDVNTNYVQFVNRLADSTELTFQLYPGESKFKHKINLEILGLPFSSNTPYSVVVNKELSTAIQGEHFDLPKKFQFEADTLGSSFDIELKKTPEMDSKTYRIVLDIVDIDKIYAGINYRHIIKINNSIVRPSWWDNDRWGIYYTYLGEYSLSKYKHFITAINENGLVFSKINFSEITEGEMYSYALIFSNYIKINSPVDEETGADITIPVK